MCGLLYLNIKNNFNFNKSDFKKALELSKYRGRDDQKIIQHKKNGILFEPGNHVDLNRKIKWALKNPKKCDYMAKNAYKDFINKYSEQRNYEILINIYKDLLKNKKK